MSRFIITYNHCVGFRDMYANVKGKRLSFDMVLPVGVRVFHLLQMQDLFHTTSVSCKP